MRKKWLVFTLVLAFLAAAAAAEAGSVPKRMNGTSWNYTGFQMTKYDVESSVYKALPYVTYGRMLNSTYNSTGDGQLSGSLDVYAGASGAVGTFIVTQGSTNSTQWRASQSFGNMGDIAWNAGMRTNSTGPYLTLEFTNATSGATGNKMTSALYFINNPAQTLFASMGSEVLGKAAPNKGSQLGLMVQNLTISNNVTDVAGTWYFYNLVGQNGTFLKTDLGTMVLSSNGNAGAMTYARINNNGTANATGTDTVTWGEVDGSTAININATTGGILADKAFLSQDKNILVGYKVPSAAGDVSTIVALKSGATVSSSDFANAGYSNFGMYMSNASGYAWGNGTMQNYYTDANRKVIAGNYTSFGSNNTQVIDSLVDKTVTVGSTTLNGITQSTMKFNNGATFIGRKISDVMAGILYDGSTGTLGLQIMVPAASSVSAPAAPSTAEVTTLNTFTFSGGGSLKVVSGTEVGTTAISLGGTPLDTLAGRFENKTSDEVKSTYGLGSGTTIDRNFPTISFAVNIGAANGGNFTVRKISFAGNNKLISELAVPTKFYVAAVTTAAGVTHAVNTYKTFTYRNAGSTVSDGSYWITPSGFPALVLNYTDANRLALGSNYDMWLAIQDNGDYDLDATGGQIADPGGFVAGLGGGGGSSSSSSDNGGCVLNPAAGVSVEMLLLMLAPLAYFIRRRKK